MRASRTRPMSRLLASIAIASAIGLPSVPAFAAKAETASPFGLVHSASEGALKTRGSVQSPLKPGDRLQAGDIVSTASGSATLLLSDGKLKTAIKLRPETSVRVFRELTGFEAVLQRGGLLSDVHNPEKRAHALQIRTRTAVMGVRGTIFYTQELKGRPLFLCTCVGKVAVRAAGPKGAGPARKGPPDEVVFESKHHDRPVTIQAGDSALGGRIQPAPMGDEHSDPEAGELEALLAARG